MKEWISVKDRLPEDHQLVLAVPENIACPVVLRFHMDERSFDGYLFMMPDMKSQVLNISYWRPLPEMPNE